tara:strand:- start:5365 stop:5823 length:459 start_codon:yes stop_codon:yes gene_type:complete
MFPIKQNKLYFINLSIFIFLLDQLSKYIFAINYKSLLKKDFLLFSFHYIENKGAAFNILSGNRILLSIVSVVITIILLYLILRIKKNELLELYTYSFILGGTIGNGIDRILKGYVIDFINLNFINFPIFNIADISINIGLILLLYKIFKNKN